MILIEDTRQQAGKRENIHHYCERHEGETVLDNCMGSGSTGVAAVNTGRRFIGIELDEGYFRTATERTRAAKQEKEIVTAAEACANASFED